jgi:hypothetical protein
METKICIGCNKELECNKDNFYYKKKYNNYESRCIPCFRNKHTENKIKNGETWKFRAKEYYIENKEIINEKTKPYRRNYYKENKEKINNQNKNNYYLNREDRSKKAKENYRNNPKHHLDLQKLYQNKIKLDPVKLEQKKKVNSEWFKKYRKKNPHLHLIRNQLKNIREILGTEKVLSSIIELKYTPDDFKKHIESMFKENMDWDNIGLGEDKWNIDHKIPITWFKPNSPFYLVNNLLNLEPIWWKENITKSNKHSTPICSNYYSLIKEFILEDKLNLIKQK